MKRPKPSKPSKPAKLDFRKLNTYPIRKRQSLVTAKQFAKAIPPISGFARVVDSLPDIYAGKAFKELVARIVRAHRSGKPVVLAIGGHVIKCGLSPVLIDLMRRGIVTGIAMNGSGAIHDYEVALVGNTSEDVTATLGGGGFGMAKETAEALNCAASRGQKLGLGFGRALGELILAEKEAEYPELSIAAEAAKLGLPVTIHVALGTDIVHMHPQADGAAIGEATMIDFRKACEIVAGLDGGVWANVGCAVILPEVFLKAVSVARNLGFPLENMCTANLDMIRHYRAETNVVQRPPGLGLSITGQHEILLPLLRLSILSSLESAPA